MASKDDKDDGKAVSSPENPINFAYLSDMEDLEPDHLLGKGDIDEQLAKLYRNVSKGFEDGISRANDLGDYWDVYNCKLNDKQTYNGESAVYVPVTHNALNARKTRFVNQVFPQSKRHVECITVDGSLPHGLLSLAEHHISTTKLRTEAMPALCITGDVEGQYTIYVSWRSFERQVKRRVKLPVDPANGAVRGDGAAADAVLVETVVDGRPEVEVIHDSDFCLLPATADSVEDALYRGGSATILRRWSKGTVESMRRDGVIDDKAAEELLNSMEETSVKSTRKNITKKLTEDKGQKVTGKEIEVYEIWTQLKVKSSEPRKGRRRKTERKLCQVFIRADGIPIGCRENPYWCNKVPILSVPVIKTAGSFKGDSRVKFCADMQYKANDAVNIAMDSAMYRLMPIVMTDPERNPRVTSMIMNMAAIWECDPNSTKVIEFPDLWETGFAIANQAKDFIMTTLSVTPAAITQTGQKKKPTQAEMANEQQVDLLTTADAVTVLEEGILSPLVQWFLDLDYQYRDRALTVKKYGPMGLEANIEDIEPLQMNERYEFRWLGVEAARNAQQVQQQIAALNVLRGVPPNFYTGYTMDLGPAIAQLMENAFGPRLAPLVFKPMTSQVSLPPEQETELAMHGFEVHTSPLDDDAAHLKVHAGVLQAMGPAADPHNQLRAHIQLHLMSLSAKTKMRQGGAGQPGSPGGAGQPGAPGQPGQPRQGAMPMRNPIGGQNPPGALPADQMNPAARAGRMPRGNTA